MICIYIYTHRSQAYDLIHMYLYIYVFTSNPISSFVEIYRTLRSLAARLA